jgi:hypothetical protein
MGLPVPISRKKKSDPKEKPILVTSNPSNNTKFHCRTDKEPTVFFKGNYYDFFTPKKFDYIEDLGI